ncbi:MAG: MBL fold metallo-hydrolase [Sphingomonadales bacterium]|nr:MBL fold metallo-hydrolase [Sphingomonadales bacterium]
MILQFLGANRQVTGSMFLLELDDGFRILVDCGQDLEKNPLPVEDTGSDPFPFAPSEIDLVLLTHAHIDHSGRLPTLYRHGYTGDILSTLPTYYLASLLLADSAQLMRKKAEAQQDRNRKRKQRRLGHGGENEWAEYSSHDVDQSLSRFVTVDFGQAYVARPNLTIIFNPTGHLLGASNIIVEARRSDGSACRIAFSGDVGRYNYPLLNDPVPLPRVDYLVCESTYGGRLHVDKNQPGDILEGIIREVCVEQSGKLLIPSFSVGRTQSLLYVLHRLQLESRLPEIPIYVDSPLAIESTRAYQHLHRFLSTDARAVLARFDDLFSFKQLHLVQSLSESKALSDHYRPCIIISASGMLEGGRIQHHLRHQLQNSKACILFIGFVAEGTFGRRLLDGEPIWQNEGKKIEVRAQIRRTDVFSGHADHNGLVEFVGSQTPETLKTVFLTHGDYPAMLALEETLSEKGYHVEIPYKTQTFTL